MFIVSENKFVNQNTNYKIITLRLKGMEYINLIFQIQSTKFSEVEFNFSYFQINHHKINISNHEKNYITFSFLFINK